MNLKEKKKGKNFPKGKKICMFAPCPLMGGPVTHDSLPREGPPYGLIFIGLTAREGP